MTAQFAANALVAGLFTGSLVAWYQTVQRLRRGEQFLPMEPRRQVPWRLLEMVLALFASAALAQLSTVWLQKLGIQASGSSLSDFSPHDQLLLLSIGALMSVFTVGFIALILIGRVSANARDLGLDFSHAASDFRTGMRMFLLVAPGVLLLQTALAPYFEDQHPLIDALKNQSSAGVFVAATIVAVAVAPITEEFLFRALLQGFIEKLFHRFGTKRTPVEAVEVVQVAQAFEAVQVVQVDGETQVTAVDSSPELPGRPSRVISVLISSLIFAAAHFGHGSAPYALFLFALGLGYVYLCTHRLLPCMVMHAALNSWSMLILFLTIRAEGR